MSATCWPWCHNWGKWEDKRTVRYTRPMAIEEMASTTERKRITVSECLVQIRTCAKCGKKKSREIQI